jgi:hypothetical protein
MKIEALQNTKLSVLNMLIKPLSWLRGRALYYLRFNLEWISVHHPNLECRVLREEQFKSNDHQMLEVSDVIIHVPSGHLFVQDAIFAKSPKLIRESTYWDPIHAQLAHGSVPKRAQRVGDKNTLFFPISNPSNYFHWLIDELPWLLRSKMYSQEVNYLHSGPLEEYQRGMLDFLSIRSNKSSPWIQVSKTLVPAKRENSGDFSRGNVEIIRKYFSQLSLSDRRMSHKRIYVSRRLSSRSLKNESEVEAYLSTNGFAILFLEEMSFSEQIQAFQNADFVISPHGAALANLIFCKKGTNIVEIFDPTYSNPCFRDLSEALDLRHSYVSYSSLELEEKFSSLFPLS